MSVVIAVTLDQLLELEIIWWAPFFGFWWVVFWVMWKVIDTRIVTKWHNRSVQNHADAADHRERLFQEELERIRRRKNP